MQIPPLNNKKIVTDAFKKAEAYQGIAIATLYIALACTFGYFYSINLLSLRDQPSPKAVPLSPEFETLKNKLSITFESTDGLKMNVANLKDTTERIVGGTKGRSNPFDSYASSRPSR